MAKYRTWHGIDASTEESLFGYGFLIRWNSKNKMYDVIIATGFDNNGTLNKFVYDSWDVDYWRETLANNNSDLEELAKMCGVDTDSYLKNITDANLLSDLIANGLCDMGDYRKTHTEMEVRKKLNKALY